MAPWGRARAGKASEKDLKQKAKLHDTIPDTPPTIFPTRAKDDAADSVQSSPRKTRGIRDSVVSLSAVNDLPSMAQSPPLPLLENPETFGRNQHKRFSLLKFRHASDSQLNKTAKEQAAEIPPVPFTPPSIIATAPTSDTITSSKRKSTFFSSKRNQHGSSKTLFSPEFALNDQMDKSRKTFDGGSPLKPFQAPPPYGDESASSLALPVNRASESDRSSGEHGVFATTTTTHTVSTTTTFFKLPRRRRDKGPLFPLPPKTISANASLGGTPRLSAAESGSSSPGRHYFDNHPEQSVEGGSPRKPRIPGLTSGNRSASRASQRSARASSQLGRGPGLDLRGRSSTMGSNSKRGFMEEDWNVPPPSMPQSTRTSTSTAGRPSLAGLFNLNRIRQSSEPLGRNSHGGPDTPLSTDSRGEKFMPVVIPQRQEGDTAAKYLARLEEVVHRSALVAIISKTDDEFMKSVLRSFMRRFSFFEDPLDMAVRKLLMTIDLPKETQQIDRTLQAFADRYHECNPGVFPDSDHAYFCAFSIVILHTDAFNKNNKRKMQKADYVKNAREQSGVSVEVMECFYDNIVYTPFIHLEDDVSLPKQQIPGQKHGKKSLKAPTTPLKKHSTGPIDPYAVILDGKLDILRPDLGEILSMDDPFNCTGTVSSINVAELNRVFLKFGVLQVLSSRSRPAAFMTQATISNPSEASIGVVDMKVTKVGVLWRKDPKKKKTRSPWQEWGAVLTSSQLYLFRNTSWVKTLMHQHDTHAKTSKTGTAVVFKPPLEQFRPDFSLPMDEVVALVDSEYKKHKNAFFFTRSTSFQEVFLADTESDLNDWIARINFAAAYRTAGVRMRGVIGSESQSQAPRPESRPSTGSEDEKAFKSPPMQLQNDANLERQVMEARTQIMRAKLKESEKQRETIEKNVESLLRLARQMCVLTPIQAKTKELIIEGTIRLAANIRWTRIESWRVKCHHDILSADLELDNPASPHMQSKDQDDLTPQPSKEDKSRLGFGRITSRAGSGTSAASRSRPPQQPNGRQLFSMDDIFRSPSRTRQTAHRSKGSWELPALAFERGRSVSTGRASAKSSEAVVDQVSTRRSDSIPPRSESSVSAIREPEVIDDEHQALVDAGILPADTKSVETDGKVEEEQEEEKAKVPELEEKGTSKVRHSLQGKLQKAHIPTPSRSRKHRDSTNSSVISDDGVSIDGSEGLTRGPGKFIVHGKKASVVTFGEDWAGISPEEGMRARISQHEDDLAPISASNDASPVIQEVAWSSPRGSSIDTIRDGEKEFVTPTEESFPVDDQISLIKADLNDHEADDKSNIDIPEHDITKSDQTKGR